MNEHYLQLNHEAHAKDLYREAENERLARSAARNPNKGLLNARQALGRGLFAVGESLLKRG